MPEMTGIDLVKALATRDVPVRAGMVTSQATDAMRELAREAGALFLLAKPFTPEGLRKALVPVLGE
jgi:two-component system chemotaxis response regulator CheY